MLLSSPAPGMVDPLIGILRISLLCIAELARHISLEPNETERPLLSDL